YECGNVEALAARVKADETIFNPNKHRLTVLDECTPRDGEVWIVPLSHPERSREAAEFKDQRSGKGGESSSVSWRLFDAKGAPVARSVLDAAIERLLCNPAIDRAVTREHA
ncbi:MAG TPA: hypothetical protein VIX60_09505, partial [Candidatus Cybelea sp.]